MFPEAPEINDGLDNQCPGDAGHGMADEITGEAVVGGHCTGLPDPAPGCDPTQPEEEQCGVGSTCDPAFCWPGQPGALEYEVVRSTTEDFSADCQFFTVLETCLFDPDLPQAGDAYFYAVRPALPFAGSWGGGDGGERVVTCTP